jgi:hypothetical protein
MTDENPYNHSCTTKPGSSCSACEWVGQNSRASAAQDNEWARQISLKRSKELLLNVLDRIINSGQEELVRKFLSAEIPARPQYAVLVKTNGSDAWYRGGYRFETREEAEHYARVLSYRWSAVVSWLIVQMPEETK